MEPRNEGTDASFVLFCFVFKSQYTVALLAVSLENSSIFALKNTAVSKGTIILSL